MGVLVIFPIAAMMAVWCKRRFEIMIFPTIVLIVVTMAVTGLVGILRIGLYVPVIYAVVALGLLISRRKKIKKYILTPGFAAFCIYIVFFLFFSKGRYLASEASYMQYGPSLMSLFTYDSLKDHSLYYNLTNPFPLGTLWVYFCGRLLGGYSESAAIFAYDVLVIAGIMPLFCQIRTIKEENWQWLAMLAIGLSLPLLKLFDAYRSFDMVVPQATAMIYTYFIFSRMIHQGEKKGDRIFAACGILFSVILTQYSMLMLLPLLAGCCAVAFSNVKKYKGLFAAMLGGLVPAIFLYVYNLIRQEILVKDLLLLPGMILGCLLLGGLVAFIGKIYAGGHQKTAVIIGCVAVVIVSAVIVSVLQNSIYKDYVVEEVVEFTDKLFEGTGEEDYVIGKHVVRVYDTTFLFLLMAVSGIVQSRTKTRKGRDVSASYAFHGAYVCGILIYLAILCVLYILKLRPPKTTPVPSIAPYVAPVIVLTAAIVFLQSFRAWKKDIVMVVSAILILGCVYTDPVGELFNKSEKEYNFPVIRECVENGEIVFTEKDRVFLMDPDLFRTVPADFCWQVYPAGAGSISGLHFNADPYRWSGGDIQFTMTKEELADLLKEEGYTYVYIRNIGDFHINKYHTLFARVGAGITNNAIYHVEYGSDGQLILRFIALDD